MRSVAILGVSGQLGQALLPVLKGEPRIQRLLGIDRRPPRYMPEGLEFHPMDLRQPSLAKTLRGVDTAISLSRSALGWGPHPSEGETLEMLTNLARSLLQAGVRRWVVVTSVAAFGSWPDNPVPLQEWHPLRPQARLHCSAWWAFIERTLDHLESSLPPLRLIRLRAAPIMGLDPSPRWASRLQLRHVALSHRIDLPIQLVHPADVAEACRLTLFGEPRRLYHLAGAEPQTLSTLYRAIGARVSFVPHSLLRALSGSPLFLPASPLPLELIPYFAHPIHVSAARARQDLGWTPRYSTLETFVEAYRTLVRHP